MTKIIFLILSTFFCLAAQAQDFNKPANTSTKTNFPIEIRANVNQCMTMDGSGTNLVTGFLRYNRSTDKWQEFTSPSTWTDAPLAATSLNVATDRLIGRDTAGTGASEELSLSGGLEFTGSAGVRIADAGVTEAKLADDAATRTTLLAEFAATSVAEGSFASQGMINFGVITLGGFKAPKALKVTHISMLADSTIQSGNWIIHLHKNGSSVATLTYDEFAESGPLSSTVSFAANDALELYIEGVSGNWFSGTTSDVSAKLWGHFTE